MAWMGTRWCVLGCAIALACGDDGADDGASSVADDESNTVADDAPSVDSSGGASTPTEASVSDDDTSADDSISATTASTSTASSTATVTATATEGTDTSADTTTGEEAFCGLDDLVGGAWFELSHHGAPLEDGDTVTIECGPQGSLMFYIETDQGGWMPSEDNIFFAITIDVDGVVGPTGHFFEVAMYGMYIGCDEFDGGIGGAPTGFFVIPPDGVDVHMLDGLSATVHIELLDDSHPTWDGTVLLEVPVDDPSVESCII